MATGQTTDYSHSGSADGQTFWVSPLEHIPAQTIALPPGDQIGIAIIQPSVACFRTTPTFNEGRFIEAVKTASRCIPWEVPLTAGRVLWEDEARHRIKCEIPENAKIQVNIKRLPHRDAVQLDAQHWPPHALQIPEICLYDRPLPAVGNFVFGVQANLIKDGVVLVIHMNHILLDGPAHGTLAALFAHHFSRAYAGKSPKKSGMVPPEALDKSLAFGTKPARNMLEWQDWKIKPEIPLSPEQLREIFYERVANLSLSIWHFPKDKLNKLRAAMQDSKDSKLSLSTCLSTWCWRIFTRARGLSSDEETRMLTPVQTRGRVKELHQTYIGSALVYGRATATVAELNTLPTSALGDRIAKSVSYWTSARIREHWGSIDDCDDIAKYQPNTDRDFGNDVEFSNTMNSPFYNINWGDSLQAKAIRFPSLAFADGYILIQPRLLNGGVEVFFYAARETLDKLMRDPEFREYAEYWAASDEKIDRLAAETAPARSKL